MLGWKLLSSKRENDANSLASILNQLNIERQDKTEAAYKKSLEITTENLDPFIFLYDESFHEGIVGLVASKLLDLYYRPTIVGTEHNGLIRCSCRSIPEFNITKALDSCADLLCQYGGHALAAGLTIEKNNIPDFLDRMRSLANQQYDTKNLHPKLKIDAEAKLEELDPKIIKELNKFEPTGEKNEQPIIMSHGVRIKNKRLVGRDGKHLKLLISDGKFVFDAIAFQFGYLINKIPEIVDIAFHYQINNYNGGLQLLVRDIRESLT
jgi:single-stranded-DNA-specific exonuclease